MPACTISGSLISSRLARRPNHAVPESGRVFPVITSIIVVLPAPFGPMMQRSSPGSTYKVSESSALNPSKLTVSFSRYKILSRTFIRSPYTLGESYQPTREKERHHHEQRAEGVEPDLGQRARKECFCIVDEDCTR